MHDELKKILKGISDLEWEKAAEAVNSKVEKLLNDLRDVKDNIEMLIDCQDRINCHTITMLAFAGFVPNRKFRFLDESGNEIGVYAIVSYNSDSLKCMNKNQEEINASYRVILDMINMNRIELLDEVQIIGK